MAHTRHQSTGTESPGFFSRWLDGIAEARLRQAKTELAHLEGYGKKKISPPRARRRRAKKTKPH
jgi:hypothetical protein